MSMKLDKKDRIILYELDRDARQPLSAIAKKAHLSRESILYRSRKYFQKGLVRNYLAVINMSKLGFTHHKVFVKLRNITEEQEQELIHSLAKNPFITWISSCDGKYSLVFAVKARTLIEFDKIMGEIRNRYWSFIMVHDTATIISGIHFHRDYLIQNKATTERKIMWGGMPEEAKLDEISIEILNELSADSRINAVKIASNLDISADAVIKRIKKLEQNGIIEHYMIWPNVNKLQGLYYKVLVTLHNFDEQKEKELHSYCLQNPNIVYIVKSLGSWQFEMDVEVRDIEEFRKLMRDFLKQFSNIVSDYTPLNIYDEHKYLFFEKECLK